MKRLLYITPYFPPNARVGALRPLKFVRYLREFNWDVTVLADFRGNYGIHGVLSNHIPPEVTILRDYSAKAGPNWQAFQTGKLTNQAEIKHTSGGKHRLWNNPELIPFGEHLLDIPHAVRAGRKLLQSQPYDAILANADPYAAGWVAMKLGLEFDIPYLVDFRDPWSVCELRRPLRPALIRWLTDYLERNIVERSAAIILNTATAMEHYRIHYGDLAPDKFHYIRNTHDTTLLKAGIPPTLTARFNILFLGNFRRFLDGREAFEMLHQLKRQGISPDQLNLVICGNITPESMLIMHELGVAAYVSIIPPVPYSEILPVMNACDILLIIANKTVQRLPSKLFDYAASEKPILCLTSAPELAQEVQSNFGRAMHFDQIDEAVQFITDHLNGNPPPMQPRHDRYAAQTATHRLATILDQSSSR